MTKSGIACDCIFFTRKFVFLIEILFSIASGLSIVFCRDRAPQRFKFGDDSIGDNVCGLNVKTSDVSARDSPVKDAISPSNALLK